MSATALLARKHDSLEHQFARLHPDLGLPSSALRPRQRKPLYTTLTPQKREARALRKSRLAYVDAAFEAYRECIAALPVANVQDLSVANVVLPTLDLDLGDHLLTLWLAMPQAPPPPSPTTTSSTGYPYSD